MTRPGQDLHEELQQLKAEIGTTASGQPAAVDADPANPMGDELRQILRQLEAAASEAAEHLADEAEEVVTGHPLAAIAAAFTLGLLVGHFWRRST
jgi:ElaB/YqjD/DUF883 family membrane-anchored ribosome-binding protein